jgi:uncharacterized protein (DUF488 family)
MLTSQTAKKTVVHTEKGLISEEQLREFAKRNKPEYWIKRRLPVPQYVREYVAMREHYGF